MNFTRRLPSLNNSHLIGFRSKRGSISFDHPISPVHLSFTPPSNISPTKPRLKFSLLRDSTSQNYSMDLSNHSNIDEKTNRIINEFLGQDHSSNEIPTKNSEENPLTVSSPSIIVTGYENTH